MKANGDCEHCGAPIPAKRGRGRPQEYCSDACRKAAKRRQQAKEKPALKYECEHCGAPMDSDQRWCSDRCEFYGRKGILPDGRKHLTAYNEAVIPVYRGEFRPWKSWYGEVYAGRRGGDQDEG